jgi:signal transduction histidine kinase
LMNLLSNAVKFTPQGGSIQMTVDGADDTAVVMVRDTGPGIPDEECEKVFDKFVQSRASHTGVGGTGLGLTICREIVQLHQGRISAVPTHGRGALLQVALPRWIPLQQPVSLFSEAPVAISA